MYVEFFCGPEVQKVTRFFAELLCFLTLLNKGDIALMDSTCNILKGYLELVLRNTVIGYHNIILNTNLCSVYIYT